MSSAGTRYIAPLLLGILLSGTSCEKKCNDTACAEDQDLQLVLIDEQDQVVIGNDVIDQGGIHLISPSNDTLAGAVDIKTGSFTVRTNRDLGLYTISVKDEANIDLIVYQSYVASEFECCPGFWRIDSVYARGESLAPMPNGQGFLLKLE